MLRWTSDREGSSVVRRQAAEVFFLGVKFEPFTGASLGFCPSRGSRRVFEGLSLEKSGAS